MIDDMLSDFHLLLATCIDLFDIWDADGWILIPYLSEKLNIKLSVL